MVDDVVVAVAVAFGVLEEGPLVVELIQKVLPLRYWMDERELQ